MPDSTEVQIETCPEHGLRYNAVTHSGCARCRKEAGEALTSVPRATLPPAKGPSRPPAPNRVNQAPMAGAVGLAVLLILLTGTLFYWAHAEIWTRGRGILGLGPEKGASSDPYGQLEEFTDELSEAAEDIDPEAAAALREMGRQLRRQGVPMDVEGELNQDDQEAIRRQIEQIGAAEKGTDNDG